MKVREDYIHSFIGEHERGVEPEKRNNHFSIHKLSSYAAAVMLVIMAVVRLDHEES